MFHLRNLSRFLFPPPLSVQTVNNSSLDTGHFPLCHSLNFGSFLCSCPCGLLEGFPLPLHTYLACTRHIHFQPSFKKSDWAIFLCSLCLQRPISVKSCTVSTQGALRLPLPFHCPSFRQYCHQPPRYSFKSLELS